MNQHRWAPSEAPDLLAQGYSAEHVAERCGLTPRQVKARRQRGVSLRAQVEQLLAEPAVKPVKKKAAKKAATKKAAAPAPRKKRAPRPKLEVVKSA